MKKSFFICSGKFTSAFTLVHSNAEGDEQDKARNKDSPEWQVPPSDPHSRGETWKPLSQLACRRWRTRKILTFLQHLLKYHPCAPLPSFLSTEILHSLQFSCRDGLESANVQMNSAEWLLPLWGDMQSVMDNTQIHVAIETFILIHVCAEVQASRDSFKPSWKVSAHQRDSRHNPMRCRWPMHHILCELLVTWGWNKWWEIVCEKSSIWLKPSRIN